MNDGSTCNVDYSFIAIKNTTNLLFLSTTNCKHFKSETSDPLAFCYSTRCKCCCLQVLGTSCIFSWLKQFNISNATFTLPMRCCCLDKFEVEDYGGRDHIRFLVQWQHGLMFIQLVINWFSFQRRKKKKSDCCELSLCTLEQCCDLKVWFTQKSSFTYSHVRISLLCGPQKKILWKKLFNIFFLKHWKILQIFPCVLWKKVIKLWNNITVNRWWQFNFHYRSLQIHWQYKITNKHSVQLGVITFIWLWLE